MATIKQVKDFIATIAPIAQRVALERMRLGMGWILPSVTIAQAACESRWGTSKTMSETNGLFGFKVGKGAKYSSAWKGNSFSAKTKEFYGQYVVIEDNFRAYDSIEDAVEDYMGLLTTLSRYKGAVSNSDPKETIKAIKKGGYATSPTYVSTIMSIINKHNLKKYDQPVTGVSGRPLVRMWSMGEDVEYLQEALILLGYCVGEIDGIFGPKTCRAVEKFQDDNNLQVDGVVGVYTWTKLESQL